MDSNLLKSMNTAFRRSQALKLYRDCLKMANMFTWNDEKGIEWSMILKVTLRKEFEAANEEKDPEILARLLVQGREALDKIKEKYQNEKLRLDAGLFAKVMSGAGGSLPSDSRYGFPETEEERQRRQLDRQLQRQFDMEYPQYNQKQRQFQLEQQFLQQQQQQQQAYEDEWIKKRMEFLESKAKGQSK